MREHVRAAADLEALRSILTLERHEGRVSENWERDFAEIRRSQEYAAGIAAGEAGIAQINAALAEDVRREDNDLIALVERLPRQQA